MAIIYRYKLNFGDNQECKLKLYEDDMNTILEKFFHNNLKDSYVIENMLEFKLYVSVEKKFLMNLGKQIKKIYRNLYPQYKGMRRIYSTYILAIMPDDKEVGYVSLEFVHYGIFYYNFKKKSLSYVARLQASRFLAELLYMDIQNSETLNKHIAPYGHKEKIYQLVKVYHRKLNKKQAKQIPNALLLEENNELLSKEYFELKKKFNNEFNEEKEYNDYFIIKKICKINIQRIREKYQQLNYFIKKEALNKFPKIKNLGIEYELLRFIVYNSGQSLMTSLRLNNKVEFFFDFGKKEKNLYLECDLVDRSKYIILSHTHSDHWNAVNEYLWAAKCIWIVPNQMQSKSFQQKLAYIKQQGGQYFIMPTAVYDIIQKKNLHITIQKIGLDNNTAHVHTNGIVLYIDFVTENGENKRIFIPGDQQLNLLDDKIWNNVQCYVACHHGGTYCNDRKYKLPCNTNESINIIYSYGKNNKYGHPSKVSEYRAAGWKQEYHTAKNGNYVLEYKLRKDENQ